MENLERSAGYDEKIEEARRERRRLIDDGKSEEEVGFEAKEKAKELRMSFLFDNAECAKLLTEYLNQNPNATEEEFRNYATETGLIIHPEVVEQFIASLLDANRARNRALEVFQPETFSDPDAEAREIYSGINPDGEYPVGKVVVDYSSPLAIQLYVNGLKDFELIDERKNVGGFYSSGQTNYKSDIPVENRYRNFPIIVIRGLPGNDTQRVKGHEIGHAENNAAIEGFPNAKKDRVWKEHKVIWNGEKVEYKEPKRVGDQLILDWREYHGQITQSYEWKYVLNHCLGRAKNELLAEYNADHRSVVWHKTNVLERMGIYDYFHDEFGLDDEPELYKTIWDEYEQTIEANFQIAKEIIDLYSLVGLFKRIKLFRWVLAQIPLQKWREQLVGTGFIKELEAIKALREYHTFRLYDIVPNPNSSRNAEIIAEIDDIFSMLADHQTEPLLGKIRNALESSKYLEIRAAFNKI